MLAMKSSKLITGSILIIFSVCPLLITSTENSPSTQEKQHAKGPSKKLQIGIKKRPAKCDKKSKKGDLLYIHYRGILEENGAEFDNSYKRGTPLTFTLGRGMVIQGWDQGLLGMCPGEKRKLVIPPELGYGSVGALPSIPPNASLIFEVECINIEDKNEQNHQNINKSEL